jgi:hypothetical protein
MTHRVTVPAPRRRSPVSNTEKDQAQRQELNALLLRILLDRSRFWFYTGWIFNLGFIRRLQMRKERSVYILLIFVYVLLIFVYILLTLV